MEVFGKYSEACTHSYDDAIAYCRNKYSEDKTEDFDNDRAVAIIITKRYLVTEPEADYSAGEKYITAVFKRDLKLYSIDEYAVIPESEFSHEDSADAILI